jgi:hypothetical protein
VSIFADFLILDALLMTIPRLAVFTITTASTTDICRPSLPTVSVASTPAAPPTLSLQPERSLSSESRDFLPLSQIQTASKYLADWNQLSLPETWSTRGCVRILVLLQLTLCLIAVLFAVLQLLSALRIRRFADALKGRESSLENEKCSEKWDQREDEIKLCDENYDI